MSATSNLHVPLTQEALRSRLSNPPTNPSVSEFVPSEHIRRVDGEVDIERLRTEVLGALRRRDDQGHGFHTRSVTRRPGATETTPADLSGRYWMRNADDEEQPFDPIVDEAAYTEIVPEFEGTYVEDVVDVLRSMSTIGRVRILGKDPYNCNSWHRDPEPRFHVPIVANPGSLFVVGNHITHLPADGSIYFTDTRGYHTALNGGNEQRISMVAAIAIPENRPGLSPTT